MEIFALCFSVFAICVNIVALVLAIWNHHCGVLERKEADKQRQRSNTESQNSDNNT